MAQVLILHNVPRSAPKGAANVYFESDVGVLDEVEAVTESLDRLGISHRVVGVSYFNEVPQALAASPEPIVFNLVESFHARPEEAMYVPAVCKAFGKAVTGNDTPCLMLTLDKWKTKCVLVAAGVPCPAGVIVPVGHRIPRSKLPPAPLIVKPLLTDASEGIDTSSIINSPGPSLKAAVDRVHKQFGHPALIEQLIGHRELNVSLLERDCRVDVLPLAEIDFSAFGEDRPKIVDYNAKWLVESFEFQHTPRIIPAPLPERVAERVRKYALAAWHATGCRDYARVDFRLSDDGEPYVLEVNPNPDITAEAGSVNALEAAGISYDAFLKSIIVNAEKRLEARASRSKASRAQKARQSEFAVRRTAQADREPIHGLLVDTKFFRPDEITVALEVLDDALAQGPDGDYRSYTVEVGRDVAGWVCFGATPCTVGTYDVYWIAVSPQYQDRGLGTVLLNLAEEKIREAGGRLSVIETSGRDIYYSTRAFYLRRGYTESAVLKDFYAPGDDKVVYTKVIAAN